MKLRGFKTLLIAGLLIGASSSPVLAQDGSGMSFGVDEAKAAPIGPSPVAGLLAQGKKLFEAKNYLEAAKKFYAVTQSDSPAAQIDKYDAQYQLAKTLFRLKLYQSALAYYNEISSTGETHPFFIPAIKNGVFELADASADEGKLSQLLSDYSKHFLAHPESVPQRYQNRFRYLVGRQLLSDPNALKLGQVQEPIKLLSAVTLASPDYAKAQYALGVAYVNDFTNPNNATLAAKSFKNSLRWLLNKGKSNLTNDEKRLVELGYLAIARVYYSIGNSAAGAAKNKDYEQAIKYYSKIDRRSENWPVALFESSWSYFRLNNFNKALGNLQSVASPFFSDRYFPEAPILSAYIYYYNCRYDRVRGILDDFDYEYLALIEDIKGLVSQFKLNYNAAFNWLVTARTSELSNKALQRVVSYTLSNKEIRGQLSYIVAMTKELKTLSELPDDFQQSKFGADLKLKITDAIANTKLDIGEGVTKRLGQAQTELENLTYQSTSIRSEIARSEYNDSEAELRSDATIAADEIKEDKIKATSEQLLWDFDGEYWRDELGYYVVSLVSKCKR